MENALEGSPGLFVPLPSMTTTNKSAASCFQSGPLNWLTENRRPELTWTQVVPPKFDNKMSTLKGYKHILGRFAPHSELTLDREER